jgi:hypothetical protein
VDRDDEDPQFKHEEILSIELWIEMMKIHNSIDPKDMIPRDEDPKIPTDPKI